MSDDTNALVPQNVVDAVDEALAEEPRGREYLDYLIATDNIDPETVEWVLEVAEEWGKTPDEILRRAALPLRHPVGDERAPDPRDEIRDGGEAAELLARGHRDRFGGRGALSCLLRMRRRPAENRNGVTSSRDSKRNRRYMMECLYRKDVPTTELERFASQSGQLLAQVQSDEWSISVGERIVRAQAVACVAVSDQTPRLDDATTTKRLGVRLVLPVNDDGDEKECWLDLDECDGLLNAIETITTRVRRLGSEPHHTHVFGYRTRGGLNVGFRTQASPVECLQHTLLELDGGAIECSAEALQEFASLIKLAAEYVTSRYPT